MAGDSIGLTARRSTVARSALVDLTDNSLERAAMLRKRMSARYAAGVRAVPVPEEDGSAVLQLRPNV